MKTKLTKDQQDAVAEYVANALDAVNDESEAISYVTEDAAVSAELLNQFYTKLIKRLMADHFSLRDEGLSA